MTDDTISMWVETHGDPLILLIGGLIIGALFGAAAQHSQFCLRSAIIDLSHGARTGKCAIWLLAFTSALVGTTLAVWGEFVAPEATRQLAGSGTFSGAALGGAIFGVGMVLARACPGRLVVLASQGNLRAVATGLVFVVVATAAYRGLLVPAREAIAGLWTVEPEARDLSRLLGLETTGKLLVGVALAALAILLARRARPKRSHMVAAVVAGLAIALAYAFTGLIAANAFNPVAVDGLSFSRSSAETLLRFTSHPDRALDFDTGLIPGVALGSLVMALATRTFHVEGFISAASMARALVGGALMGLGAIAAAGCSIGAGVTGSVMWSATALTALFAMTGATLITHALVDKPRLSPATQRPHTAASTLS